MLATQTQTQAIFNIKSYKLHITILNMLPI